MWKWAIILVEPNLWEYSLHTGSSSQDGTRAVSGNRGEADCDWDKQYPRPPETHRAQKCRKFQERLNPPLLVLTYPQSLKACSLSLPDQLHFWPQAKQYLNFPARKENLCLPDLLGHIIPILTAKPITHLDICEEDLTQSGCSLIWKIFQSATPFLRYMGYSKSSSENISSFPASELG